MQQDPQLSLLLKSCKKGDRQALARLVDLYSGRCYGYFYRLTANAELSNDLLGELFLKIVSKIGQYNDGNFDFWIFKIASNIWHDHLRSLQREKKLIENRARQLESDSPGRPEEQPIALDGLQNYLEKLDEPTRELLVLRFYSEMSFKEIAAARGEPIGTVLSRIHRGLAKLRGLMEKEYEKQR